MRGGVALRNQEQEDHQEEHRMMAQEPLFQCFQFRLGH